MEGKQIARIALDLLLFVIPLVFSMPTIFAVGFGAAAWLLLLVMVFDNVQALRRLPWTIKLDLGYGASLIVVWALYSPVYAHYEKEKAATYSGDLTVHRGWLMKWAQNAEPYTPIPMYFGYGGSAFAWGGERGGTMFVSQHGPYLTLDRDDYGDPLLTTTIRDSQGKVLVEIIRNHWIISKSNELIWDKNYRDDSLELIDSRKRIVFQVQITKKQVHLLANLYHEENGRWVNMSLRLSDEPDIFPMFRYPAAEHLGQWNCRSLSDGGGAPC